MQTKQIELYNYRGESKFLKPEYQPIATLWGGFKKHRYVKDKTLLITRDEFMIKWIESGKWEEHGQCLGQYTMWPNRDANPLTINDCEVKPWDGEMRQFRPENNGYKIRQDRINNKDAKAAKRADRLAELERRRIGREERKLLRGKTAEERKAKALENHKIIKQRYRERVKAKKLEERVIMNAEKQMVREQINAEKAREKEIKQLHNAYLRDQKRKAKQEEAEAKSRYAYRPANEPIPKKERKPRAPKQTPKYYAQSEVTAIKKSLNDYKKQSRNGMIEKLDQAIIDFYNESKNPMNAKILELAKQPRTNYRSHNLIIMGVRKVVQS